MREEGQRNLTQDLIDALRYLDELTNPNRPPCPSQQALAIRYTLLRMYGDLRQANGILDALESERR